MKPLTRSEEKLVRSLGRRRVREDQALFLAEGIRVVEELLRSGIVPRLALLSSSLEDTSRGRALAAALRERGVAREVGDAELAGLADTSTTQGVLVVAEMPAAGLAAVEPGAEATALVLDGVQDPGNLGTLARSAAAFGCDALICLPGTVDPWNPKAVRASAGALFRFPVVTAGLEAAVHWLERHGFELLGADAAGEPVERVEPAPRVALVVGNEGAGLSQEARARCARLVAVRMREGTESLNVAVATGILLYLITRGRA